MRDEYKPKVVKRYGDYAILQTADNDYILDYKGTDYRNSFTSKHRDFVVAQAEFEKILKKAKKTYEYQKSRARDYAVDIQSDISNHNYSYGEILEYQEKLRKIAKKYGLTKEFREEGLI